MSRFRNHSSSSTFERESSPLPKSYQAGVRKKAPARQQPFQQKCNAPLPTDAFFGLCWLDVICITVLLHTHTHCRKVIFVIFIISTISCRKTIIRAKSIRLKKCCETLLLTGDKINLLCWVIKNFQCRKWIYPSQTPCTFWYTIMYSSQYVSG